MIPGVGTFAQKSACAESSLIDVRSIGDEIAERGNRHRVIVHCLEEITVPPDIAVKMGYLGIPRRIDT